MSRTSSAIRRENVPIPESVCRPIHTTSTQQIGTSAQPDGLVKLNRSDVECECGHLYLVARLS